MCLARSENVPAFRVTALAPSASIADAVSTHWREYLMEATEIGVLMLSTCICGTLIYADESPIKSLGLAPAVKSMLMGTAIAITTFLIIRSSFGRRSGAHFNPAVTLTFLWLKRVHRWDAHQNLWWAAGYNTIAFPVAAGVFYPAFGFVLRPEIAAISMSGSSLLVAVNALMLKRTRLQGIKVSPQ